MTIAPPLTPLAIGLGPQPTEIPPPERVGHKAHGLFRLWSAGVDVPPAFVFDLELFRAWRADRDGALDALRAPLLAAIADLEHATGRTLGGETAPLILSVRSGAPVSMPGILATILNVGVSEPLLAALDAESDDDRFAADCLSRFVFDFGTTACGVHAFYLDEEIDAELRERKLRDRSELDRNGLIALSRRMRRETLERSKRPWPETPFEMVVASIDGVLRSWDSDRAMRHRKRQRIADVGTAVIVQAMVFGNRNARSGAGAALSRDPSTGERGCRMELVQRSQGEDLAGGRVRPTSVSEGPVFEQVAALSERVEWQFGTPVEIEFTVDDGRVWALQARRAVLSAIAEVNALVELVDRGVIDELGAIARLRVESLSRLVEARLARDGRPPAGRGLGASPGAVVGRAVFDADAALAMAARGESPILMTTDLRTDDMRAVESIVGFVAARGGLTSHAAVLTRQLGIPCVVSCEGLRFGMERGAAHLGTELVRAGDRVAIDGRSGEVYTSEIAVQTGSPPASLQRLVSAAEALVEGPDAEQVGAHTLEVARILCARFGHCCDRA